MQRGGANGDKGCGVVQWSNGNVIRLALDLGCDEVHATCHLFYVTDLAEKRVLEGVHIRIEALKLNVAQFTKFGDSIVSNLRRDIELDEATVRSTRSGSCAR